MTDSNTNRSTRRRALVLLSGGFVAVLFAGAIAIAAVPSTVAAFGRHAGHGMHNFMQWRMEKMLDGVEATDEQKQKIREIVESRMESLHELHPDREALHDRAIGILTADEIDREALEAFRAEQFEQLATASRLLSESLADVAEVLTSEQRVELAKLAEERHGGRGGRHRRHAW